MPRPPSRPLSEDLRSIIRDVPIVSSGLVGRAARAIRGRAKAIEDSIERKRDNQTTDSNNR